VSRVESSVLHGLLLFAAATLLLSAFMTYVICSRHYNLHHISFFRICAIGYLFNSISLITLNVGKSFAALGWMPQVIVNSHASVRIIHFLLFFVRTGELHTTVFTALNRASAILMPTRYLQ
ncbi:hypothetical protein PMAYCL1PPCAC_16471, partial [Pristionchus mayeri]